jgi:hypothetical protein
MRSYKEVHKPLEPAFNRAAHTARRVFFPVVCGQFHNEKVTKGPFAIILSHNMIENSSRCYLAAKQYN